MEIKHSVETPEGAVVFQGILEGPELTLVIETGLNQLMQQGLVPFLSVDGVDMVNIMDLPEDIQ